MDMIFTETPHGFAIAKFTDQHGVECSIQKSARGCDNTIWIGTNNNSGRMLLTQEQVAALVPHLQGFVETGDLI